MLAPTAMGFLAMAKYRAARVFFCLSTVMLAIKTVSSAEAYFPTRWVPFGEFIGLSVSILYLLAMLIWVDAEQQQKTPERADILVTLVIDTVRGSAITFHLEIENGPIRIQDIRTRIRTPEFIGSEIVTPTPRVLAPKGKLSIHRPIAILHPERHNSLMVYIAYRAILHHQWKDLWLTCRFLVGPEVKPGTYYPDGINTGEGPLAFKQETENIDLPARFAEPQGSWFVVLPEVNRDGKFNFCSIRNEHRAFVFDPESRNVVFQTRVGDGAVMLSVEMEQSNSALHVIAIVWGPSGGLLTVDNNEARSPHFNNSEANIE